MNYSYLNSDYPTDSAIDVDLEAYYRGEEV
jgi:hypothetical protein